jgi:hypothetical protein
MLQWKICEKQDQARVGILLDLGGQKPNPEWSDDSHTSGSPAATAISRLDVRGPDS